MTSLANISINQIRFFIFTILFHLDFIHLQFQPGPIKDLVDEHAAQENLGKGAGEGPILVHLNLQLASWYLRGNIYGTE